MSLTHAIGNVSGSASSSVRLPITVWDDAFADIDEDDAIEHAVQVAPDSILSMLQTDDPAFSRLAGHIVVVEIEYTPPEIQPRDPPPTPETGTMVRRFSFQAQGKRVTTPLEPIGVFDESG